MLRKALSVVLNGRFFIYAKYYRHVFHTQTYTQTPVNRHKHFALTPNVNNLLVNSVYKNLTEWSQNQPKYINHSKTDFATNKINAQQRMTLTNTHAHKSMAEHGESSGMLSIVCARFFGRRQQTWLFCLFVSPFLLFYFEAICTCRSASETATVLECGGKDEWTKHAVKQITQPANIQANGRKHSDKKRISERNTSKVT